MSDFKAKIHHIRFWPGLRPRPRWGSLHIYPRSSSWSSAGGLLLMVGGGKEREGREDRGRREEGWLLLQLLLHLLLHLYQVLKGGIMPCTVGSCVLLSRQLLLVHSRLHSSSVVTLYRPPTSSSLRITNRSFRYASPHLWNQLPVSFRQPCTKHVHPADDVTLTNSHPTCSPLSPSNGIHHIFTVSFRAQNSPFPQIFSTIVC